jgi:hypothetical protein
MDHTEYMRKYRKEHPEFTLGEDRKRRARTEAMRRLRNQFRVEYEYYLMDALKKLDSGGESNE